MVIHLLFVVFLALEASAITNRPGKGLIATIIMRQKLLEDYQKSIIDRNEAIFKHLYMPPDSVGSMDIVIYHEGDLELSHQQFIQSRTSNMPIKFVNLSDVFQLFHIVDKPYCPNSIFNNATQPGYFSMCHFWFSEFANYTQQYDWLLRIDDDCILLKDSRHILHNISSKIHFASPRWDSLTTQRYDRIAGSRVDQNKFGHVVRGMRDFVIQFAQSHNIFNDVYSWSAPYTNVMYIDLNWYRNHTILQEFTKQVRLSDCIYSNRWGDLPLWGANILLVKEPHYKLHLSYFHGSHKVAVHGEEQN